jgi:predicted porin
MTTRKFVGAHGNCIRADTPYEDSLDKEHGRLPPRLVDALREASMQFCKLSFSIRRVAFKMTQGFLCCALLSAPAVMHGQETTDTAKVLEQRVEHLEQELASLQAQLEAQLHIALPQTKQAANTPRQASAKQSLSQQAPPQHSAPATVPGSTLPSSSAVNPDAIAVQTAGATLPTSAEQSNHRFFERKPGKDLTFYTHHGEITFYGNLDVSFDALTKGTANFLNSDGNSPVGNMGWLPDLSTNLSYIGIRGTQASGIKDLNFVYQLETQLDISATSGSGETNSTDDNVVKGGLTSRNSFIGLGSPRWGAVLFGKTDAPYKLSTARLNPFVGMIGDYAAIMGNTGGDTRVEFGTRLDHSVWFTSRKYNGFELNALYEPGQNRSDISDNIAAGESDCTGGDNPGDGGDVPLSCDDGGFGNAYSASFSYTNEPLYVVASYERHRKVNRQSDLTGEYGDPPTAYFDADVADEDAAKVGIQYTLPSKTVVSAIYENLHRYIPYFLEFQNERQRQGSWLAVTQALGSVDSISAGWARAYRAPGDPGQHNTSLVLPPLGSPGDAVGGRGADNSANLFTVAYRHRLADGLTAYAAWAATFNAPYGHFDLGGGGRGVTADCHDASDAVGDENSAPHCWAGGHLKGISVGLDKRF